MIDGQNFFDQPVKNNLKTFDSIGKVATDKGDNYTIGWTITISKIIIR